jgi:hypothetical protein
MDFPAKPLPEEKPRIRMITAVTSVDREWIEQQTDKTGYTYSDIIRMCIQHCRTNP